MKVNLMEELTSNRLDSKAEEKKKRLHMEMYERQQGKAYILPEGTDKIYRQSQL